MKRHLPLLAAFLIALFSLPAAAFGVEVYYEELITIGIGEFAVGWQTSEPVVSEIAYGQDPPTRRPTSQ